MNHADIEHIQDTYRAHRQALYTYALSMIRSKEAAEDVVHTVFAEVLSREVLPLELRPYLFRCIRNRAIDAMRKRSRETLSDSIFKYGSDGRPCGNVNPD